MTPVRDEGGVKGDRTDAPCLALALLLAFWGAIETGRALLEEAARRDAAPAALDPPRIDLDRDPAHRLQLLPGIGPVRADSIVKARRRGGSFDRPEDLQRVWGIGPHTVALLRESGLFGPKGGPAAPRSPGKGPRRPRNRASAEGDR